MSNTNRGGRVDYVARGLAKFGNERTFTTTPSFVSFADSDPWNELFDKIARKAFGTITYSGGVRTVVPPVLTVAQVGNSHGLAQGASSVNLSPAALLVKWLRLMLPDWTVNFDNYAVAGSWCAQIPGQIEGFTRAADIVVVLDPTNDGIGNIFMGYEGYVGPNNTAGGYELALEDVFEQIHDLGAAVVNLTAPYPHASRSKANNRLSTTYETLMTWPVTSLIGFFLEIVFTQSNQRISAYARDLDNNRVPFDLFNQYSNGLFAVGQYLLEFDPSNEGAVGAQHQVTAIDPAGTWVTVNGTILADKDDLTTSVRQSNFNNETQVWPSDSQALVQRDVSGTGALVAVSWRHWELNKVNRRVAARNGVVTVDWGAIQGALIKKDTDYDFLYPNGDDFHMGDYGYLLVDGPMKLVAQSIVNGTILTGVL